MALNKHTNIIVFALIICLCFMLGGCDNTTDESTGNDEIKEIIAMPEPETISIMLPDGGRSLPEEVIDEINSRTKKALNLTVRFEKAYNQTSISDTSKMAVNIFKRRNFDAVVLWYNFPQFVEQDALMDLSELLPKYAPNLFAHISETEQEIATYNGKLLAIPSHGAKGAGLYFAVRSDIAERCGISEISTIEDIDNALKVIKEKETITPLYKESINPQLFMYNGKFVRVIDYFYFKKDDPSMKVLPYEQFEEYAKVSEIYQRWKNSQYFSEADLDETASFFAGGLQIADYYRKGKISGNYKLFELSSAEGIAANLYYVHGIAINKDSKKAEHVLRFLDWIYSDRSNYDLIMYGIEGKNYTLKDGKIVPDEQNGLINWLGSLAFLRYDFERLYENDPELVKELYRDTLEAEYQIPPHYGFMPDFSKLSDKLRDSGYYSELQKISDAVFKGTSDMTISEYIQYQKDLGVDDIAKELQAQLNSWLNKNKEN